MILKGWILLFCYFRLSEVGKLEAPKLGSNYDTGQLFLHKVTATNNDLFCDKLLGRGGGGGKSSD